MARAFSLREARPRWWLVLAALVAAGAWSYLRPRTSPGPSRLQGETMGTTYTVLFGQALAEGALAAAAAEVAQVLATVNAQMSTYDPTSELSRLNRSSEFEVVLSEPLAFVLGAALQVSAASEGRFDVTVGPLVDLWGFGPPGAIDTPPSAARVAEARRRVGWERLHLEGRRLARRGEGIQIDLSAIAKGYGVDRVAEALRALGHRRFMVEIGGEVRAQGTNAEGQPFRIGVEDPTVPDRRARLAVALSNSAMATSGNYRNVAILDGIPYAHTLDPVTGMPTRHRLLSVSVVHPSCMMADAWATALMAAGPEDAIGLADREGLAALLLIAEDDGTVREMATQPFRPLLVKPLKGR